jgi:hypothetical protein
MLTYSVVLYTCWVSFKNFPGLSGQKLEWKEKRALFDQKEALQGPLLRFPGFGGPDREILRRFAAKKNRLMRRFFKTSM